MENDERIVLAAIVDGKERSEAEWRTVSNIALRWRYGTAQYRALADAYYLRLQYARAMAQGGERLQRFANDYDQFLTLRTANGRAPETVSQPTPAQMHSFRVRLRRAQVWTAIEGNSSCLYPSLLALNHCLESQGDAELAELRRQAALAGLSTAFVRAPAAVATRAMGKEDTDEDVLQSLAPEERALADAALEKLLDKIK
jgi:hypothetical protein